MTEYQQYLLAAIRDYPQRFRRKDKERFLAFLENELADLGFQTRRREGHSLLLCVNLETVSEVEEEVILLAHYDTPTILPPVLEPLVRLTGHNRQLLLMVLFVAVLQLFSMFEHLPAVSFFETLFWFSFLTLLIPNPKNFNDNTSGVLGLLFLAEKISRDEALRGRVRFAFLDNEENGLLGATVLRRHWLQEDFPFHRKPIISLDCIGRGKVPVIVRNSKDLPWGNLFFERFRTVDPASRYLDMAFLPINDNFIFRKEGALVVTMMTPSLIPGGYYIDNIHSPLDNYLEGERVDWVAERVWEFLWEWERDLGTG